MKPSELARFLALSIRNRLPVLISGAPGIGKSDIVAQAATEAGATLILSHPVVADPTDAKGLPWVAGDGEGVPTEATFLPFGELAQAIRAEEPTVWFLDDLGQATPAVQASFMQLLLARRVNGHRLPDCVSFVAATNRRVDRAGVSGILEPVKSRFAAIVELEADIISWSQWAIDNGMPVELIAFLRFRPDLLSSFSPSADLTNSPVPRTWANLGKLFDVGIPRELESSVYSGAVGAGAATEFLAFLRLYRELPSIDAILMDPSSGPIPSSPAGLYAVSTALAMRGNATTSPRIAQYAQRLMDAGNGEFATLLLRDLIRRCPEATQSPEFVRLSTGELGNMMTGGN